MIRPNRSTILKEATLRSLNQGELTPGQPFKPAQEAGLRNYYEFLNGTSDDFERRHGYFDMATSTGKTGLFSLVSRHAHRIAQEKGIGDSFKTLIVEPTVPLMRQTRKELLRVAPEMSSAVGLYGGGSKDLDKPTTIISYDSWLSLLEDNQLQGTLIDLNINDESHNGLSLRRQNLINEVLTNAHHLGFTASSKYDAEKTMQLTHRNLIYEIGLRDAIEGGMLAEYVHVQYAIMRLMPVDMNQPGLELSNADFTFLKRREWSRLITRAFSSMVDGISGEPLSNKIALFYGANTSHADRTAEMLNNDAVLQEKAKAKGFKKVATSIHSIGYSNSTQDRLQEEFEAGEYMAAVGDKKFQAGFDYPRVKLIASYPGASAVDTVQEMGRATRPYVDPVTGEDQGAVIFEAIPYVGDIDPKKDQRARDNALRNIVTARDILGGTLVLKPGKMSSAAYDKGRGSTSNTPISLSPGCTVEVFLSEEETLTISRQVEIARSDRVLSEELIVDWAKATHEKTGEWPSVKSKIIWTKGTDEEFEIVNNETGISIDNALKKRTRGLVNQDGSPVADSLHRLLAERGFIEGKMLHTGDLSEDQIIEWVLATQKATGRLPTQTDRVVWQYNLQGKLEVVQGETWRSIHDALGNKHRGLTGENDAGIAQSLMDFKRKHGFVETQQNLTEKQIINWVLATIDKTGKIPSTEDQIIWCKNDDGYEHVPGETWKNIDHAIRNKTRGLVKPDGSAIADSLAGLKKQHGLTPSNELTEQQIKDWIIATNKQTGNIPSVESGAVWEEYSAGLYRVVEGITWRGIESALKRKLRGLKKADGSEIATSLADFKKRHGLENNKRLNDAAQRVKKESAKVSTKSSNNQSPSQGHEDVEEIAKKTVTDLFTQFSDGMVAKITAAVVASLSDKVPARKRTKEVTSKRPVSSVTIFDEGHDNATVVAGAAIAAPIQEAPTSQFARFNAPLFAKPDARGDSMLSLLINAERAFGYGDPIGIKANLRKFAEVFMHRTLTSIDSQYLASLGIAPEHKSIFEKIVRDYGYTCANVEASESKGSGLTKREPLIKMSDITRAFRDFSGLMKTAKPEVVSIPLNDCVFGIIAAGGGIHLQITERDNLSDEQVLRSAFDLANWFEGQFCASGSGVSAGNKQTIVFVKPHIIAEVKPDVSEAKPDEASVDEDELPPKFPATILKVLGVTEEGLTEELQGSRGHDFTLISDFAMQWVNEDVATKRARNRLCTKLYAEAAPMVKEMVAHGKNIEQIVMALNEQNIGYNVNKKTVGWNTETLLRGAVLTSGSLPLEIFALPRNTSADKGMTIRAKRKPDPA